VLLVQSLKAIVLADGAIGHRVASNRGR